jgi:hypothetical protein
MTALLNKLGIVAAATTAAILAVSPLAFAGDDNNDHSKKDGDGDGSRHHSKIEDSQLCSADNSNAGGLLNLLNIGNGNVLSCDDVNVQVAVAGVNKNG